MIDITQRKQAEEERERLHQALEDLAHINRVTMMGELTASLAHEVNQPIAAAVTDAKTCIRWLTRDHPDLEEAREAASRTVKDATRAGEIINRIRLIFKKGTSQWEPVDVNETIREMVMLLSNEAARYSVSIRTELAEDLPEVMGDRVQLQQVMMNLMINGIDAMKEVDATRTLTIKSQRAEDGQLVVSVSDSGVGLPAAESRADIRSILSPLSSMEPVWDFGSAAPLSNRMVAVCGLTNLLRTAQVFTSPCLPSSGHMHDGRGHAHGIRH